jgi:hypothetical protein
MVEAGIVHPRGLDNLSRRLPVTTPSRFVKKFAGWRESLDVLWWLQLDVCRLWLWLKLPMTLYEVAVFMPEYDYTSWSGTRWGYARPLWKSLFSYRNDKERGGK